MLRVYTPGGLYLSCKKKKKTKSFKAKDLEFSDWILSNVEVHSLYINSSPTWQ